MFDRLIDRIGDVQGKATVRTVFGDPMQVHGRTIIPVAKVRFGFGMGMGRGKDKDDERHDDDRPTPQAAEGAAAPSSGPSP